MTLVTNGRLITRDSEGKGYYEHGAVAYEGTKIVEVGEEAALRAKYADAQGVSEFRRHPHVLPVGYDPYRTQDTIC